MKIIKKWKHIYPNGDMEFVEIIKISDELYPGGIKFSYIYLCYEPSSDNYVRAFAFDNSHGKTHIHSRVKNSIYVDFDWKKALQEFGQMVRDYQKQQTKNRQKPRCYRESLPSKAPKNPR
jgi:hypothetical protein